MYVECILVILTVLTCFIWRYRKRIKIINLATMGFAVYFLSQVKDTPDINNYIYAYYREGYTFKDVGFKTVCNFFKGLGLDYYQFQTVYFLITICIIVYALLRLSEKRTLIYILYILFPFLYSAIQIRNFFVLGMITLGFSLSATTKKPIKTVSWIVCVLIASTQHVLALGFLPFAFLIDKKNTSVRIMQVMCVITVVFLLLPNSHILSVITNVFSSIADEHRTMKYTVRSTHLGHYVMIGRSVLMLLIANMTHKKAERICAGGEMLAQMGTELEALSIAENLMIYSSLFWPLYVLNGNFTRLMQDESIVLYYVISIYGSLYNITSPAKRSFRIPVNLPSFLSSVLIIYNAISLWVLNYETVVEPLLRIGK